MAGDTTITASLGETQEAKSPRQRRGFFFGMSSVLLLIVVLGFAPTLYLRTFFDAPSIPLHLYIHGSILTGWFVWLVVQTSLVRSGRIAGHRRLGVFGAIYGLAVVVGGLLATFSVVPRLIDGGFDLNMGISALGISGLGAGVTIGVFLSGVVWSNIASVVSFAVLLISAILLRRRTEAHKRLMLLASISIIGPALARISRWPIIGDEQGPFIPIALVLLLAALLAYDFYSRQRLHVATLLGVTFAVLTAIGGQIIAATEYEQAFVRGLA